MIDIYYDVESASPVDSAGGNSDNLPRLQYQAGPTWRCRFVTADPVAGTTTAVDVSDAVAWAAAVDDGFDHASEPMCRTLNANIDSSDAANGIIDVLLDANTTTFEDALGTKEKLRQIYFELRGLDSGGLVVHSILFVLTATNSVDPAGGDPPEPIGNYYTKTQVDALLRAGLELQFSADDISYHTTQTGADRYYQYRYPAGSWSTTVAMVVGPTGPVGSSGPTGAVGSSGPTGPVGSSGPSGAVGSSGPVGNTGPTGAVGSSGPTGTGNTGPTGPVGSSGPTGAAGGGVVADETFVDGDLTAGVLTVSGLKTIVDIVDNDGKVIYPDEIDYGVTDTTVDLSSFGTLTGTWSIKFGQGTNETGPTGPTGPTGVGATGPTGSSGPTGSVSSIAEIGIAISDETTDLTTGAGKATFRMPFAMTLTEVRANVNTAPVGSTIIVDINESGSSVLSTKITIDATEKTSETAVAPPVISDSALADDAEITIDIDQIGSSTAGTGLKVWLIGTRA